MKPGAVRFLQAWLINTFAVLVAAWLISGIHYEQAQHLLLASLTLGILNTVARPFMMFLALPLLVFTLGLFLVIINALLLCLVSWLVPGFTIDGFGSALLGALVISVISMVLNLVTRTGKSRVTIRRSGPEKRDQDGGGNGPVIDI